MEVESGLEEQELHLVRVHCQVQVQRVSEELVGLVNAFPGEKKLPLPQCGLPNRSLKATDIDSQGFLTPLFRTAKI